MLGSSAGRLPPSVHRVPHTTRPAHLSQWPRPRSSRPGRTRSFSTTTPFTATTCTPSLQVKPVRRALMSEALLVPGQKAADAAATPARCAACRRRRRSGFPPTVTPCRSTLVLVRPPTSGTCRRQRCVLPDAAAAAVLESRPRRRRSRAGDVEHVGVGGAGRSGGDQPAGRIAHLLQRDLQAHLAVDAHRRLRRQTRRGAVAVLLRVVAGVAVVETDAEAPEAVGGGRDEVHLVLRPRGGGRGELQGQAAEQARMVGPPRTVGRIGSGGSARVRSEREQCSPPLAATRSVWCPPL